MANIYIKFAITSVIFFMANALANLEASGQARSVKFQRFLEARMQLELLSDSQAKKDLELAQDQVDELASFKKRFDELNHDLLRRRATDKSVDRVGVWLAEYEKARDEVFSDVLLPFQSDRLKQLTLSRFTNSQDVVCGLLNLRLVEELGISNEQKRKLEKIKSEAESKIMSLQRDHDEKIKEEYSAKLNKLAKSLTSEQRKMLQSRLGVFGHFK